ncbi:MAG: PfkB family carbohydrate kinase [Bacteroidales bacterium]|jgi:fructokinase|nr:PfkB family carbohydrate kinase [Bacteroidales bacterium]
MEANHKAARRIFAVGETLLDVIFKDGRPVSATPGGSALNTAVSLGRMGLNVHFISEYGTDRVGNLVEAFLKQNGIQTGCIRRYSGYPSALALAFLDEHNNAEYQFYKNYPPDRLNIAFPELTRDDIVLFGSFYGIDPALRKRLLPFLEHARRQDALILYDPNIRASYMPEMNVYRPVITENFRMADVVKGSAEDFAHLFSANGSTEAWQHIRNLCDVLVYTAGGDHVALHLPGVHETCPVPALQPVSTVGAGDTFNAGLICGLVAHGICKKTLKTMTAAQRADIINVAIRFARQACMSYDNYVPLHFADPTDGRHAK